jgi:hypothetical protein
VKKRTKKRKKEREKEERSTSDVMIIERLEAKLSAAEQEEPTL